MTDPSAMPSNFIYDAVRADVEQGKRDGRVQTLDEAAVVKEAKAWAVKVREAVR